MLYKVQKQIIHVCERNPQRFYLKILIIKLAIKTFS